MAVRRIKAHVFLSDVFEKDHVHRQRRQCSTANSVLGSSWDRSRAYVQQPATHTDTWQARRHAQYPSNSSPMALLLPPMRNVMILLLVYVYFCKMRNVALVSYICLRGHDSYFVPAQRPGARHPINRVFPKIPTKQACG